MAPRITAIYEGKKLSAVAPGTFRAASGPAAGFMGFAAWDQSHGRRAKEDSSSGWTVPLFVVFAV
jgi:hypothetical protein